MRRRRQPDAIPRSWLITLVSSDRVAQRGLPRTPGSAGRHRARPRLPQAPAAAGRRLRVSAVFAGTADADPLRPASGASMTTGATCTQTDRRPLDRSGADILACRPATTSSTPPMALPAPRSASRPGRKPDRAAADQRRRPPARRAPSAARRSRQPAHLLDLCAGRQQFRRPARPRRRQGRRHDPPAGRHLSRRLHLRRLQRHHARRPEGRDRQDHRGDAQPPRRHRHPQARRAAPAARPSRAPPSACSPPAAT